MKIDGTVARGDNGKIRYFVTIEIRDDEYDYYSRLIGKTVRDVYVNEYGDD